MTDYVRVRWAATGHHSTIPAHRYDAERHTKLKSPAVDRNGVPIPPKYKTSVAEVASESKAGSATKATDDKKES